MKRKFSLSPSDWSYIWAQGIIVCRNRGSRRAQRGDLHYGGICDPRWVIIIDMILHLLQDWNFPYNVDWLDHALEDEVVSRDRLHVTLGARDRSDCNHNGGAFFEL